MLAVDVLLCLLLTVLGASLSHISRSDGPQDVPWYLVAEEFGETNYNWGVMWVTYLTKSFFSIVPATLFVGNNIVYLAMRYFMVNDLDMYRFSLLAYRFSLLTSHLSLITSHLLLLTSHFSLLAYHFSLITYH